MPLWERGERDDGTFPRSAFAFDAESNTLTCPGGKTLKQFRRAWRMQRTGVTKAGQRLYRASKADCDGCALKARCCPRQPHRKAPRSVHETARDAVRRLEGTPAYLQSRRDRKKVEMLFAPRSKTRPWLCPKNRLNLWLFPPVASFNLRRFSFPFKPQT